VRSADDADVHRERLRAAEAFDGAIFEDAQHFGLRDRIHIADFVEEDGAAVGLPRNGPFFWLHRAGEGAAFVAEEFGFDEGFGRAAQFTAYVGFAGSR